MLYGDLDHGRPNDQRGFIHKKLFGVVKKVSGFLPIPAFASGVLGAIAGKLQGRVDQKQAGLQAKFPELGVGPLQPLATTVPSTVPRLTSPPRAFRPRQLDDQSQRPCPFPGQRRLPGGQCTFSGPGVAGVRPVGDAVMGQYGAGLTPGSLIVDRAVCLPGMQLGNDGLCYNKSQITNKQRMWPAGRKPLLTGGDMRAISTAARAGRRLDLATKRLQKMGMMKKPASRAARAHAHAKAATGVVSV